MRERGGSAADPGARRLAALETPRLRRLALLTLLLVLAVCAGRAARFASLDDAQAIGIDFFAFWGAAQLALEQGGTAAFDVVERYQAESGSGDTWLPWLYPAHFLLALLPLALLPFTAAWAVFTAASLAALMVAARGHARGAPSAWLMLACAPAFVPGLEIGQTTQLWAAGLLAVLALLREGRQVPAGIVLGLLTFKPQLGLLLPLALIAAGQWRCFAAATVTTLIAGLAGTLVFGVEYWSRMLEQMSAQAQVMDTVLERFSRMSSAYASLAELGLARDVAMGVQVALTALAAGGVVWAWSRRELDFDLKAALLCAAIPLATPYLLFYDSAFVALSAFFLVRSGAQVPKGGATVALAALWLSPLPQQVAAKLSGWAGDQLTLLVFPVLPLAFLLTALAAIRGCREAGGRDRAAPR